MAYQKQGRAAEAEPLFRRSLDILEKALGPEHHRVASPLRNLAILAQGEGRYAEAQSLYARSLAVLEKALGPRHPEVGEALSHLAGLAFAQGDWAGATGYWRRSIDIITQRAAKGSSACGQEASGSEAQRRASRFRGLVKAAHRLSAQDTAAAEDMFRMAQWMQASQAAASLAQMAARLAKGSSELARLVRERQDLVGECSEKDRLLIAAKGKPPAERRAEAEAALAERLTAIDLRLAAIDLQLAKGFPDYAAMASPAPASVTEVQAQLRADEALVLVLGTPAWKPLPEESFIWVVTRSQIRWVRTGLGTKALTESVAALRCGLDKALWNDGAKSERCVQMLGAYRYDAGPLQNVLPFDLERAHTLYKALLGPAEDLLAAKHLLVVAPGPLSTLPFHVLVAEPPKTALPADPAGYRDVAWLGTRQPITVLPAVASLKALRQHAKASRAGRAYLGIGNPLLDGSADKDHTRLARSAHNWQRCSAVPSRWQLVASALDGRLPNLRAMLPARHADIEYVRRQVPLPETAFELCETARDLGMPESEVLLGGQATETAVKDLSEKGVLATYRVVHFATHGALAGEVKGPSETEPAEEAREMSEPGSPDEPEPIATADSLAEPGLLLTPPPAGTSDATLLDRDDGFLTASEIAGLKLDAEWVVLSACNTAGTAGAGAEALSGLAKAFFYAGARSLLVSHWGVSSYAAVKLTTRAFQELEADRSVGRAEVLRRSMRDLIETGSPLDAHPMTWAAFVVVGEGAR
jgi:CHAT domain-containing protein